MSEQTPGCGSNSEARKRAAAAEHAGCIRGLCRAGNHHEAVRCDEPAAQRPEGVTVTEWGVSWNGGAVRESVPPTPTLRGAAQRGNAALFTRQRTTFPDVVTEWAEVSGDTEAGGGA